MADDIERCLGLTQREINQRLQGMKDRGHPNDRMDLLVLFRYKNGAIKWTDEIEPMDHFIIWMVLTIMWIAVFVWFLNDPSILFRL
jgi:hypothetical protein